MSKPVPGTPYVHRPPRRLEVTFASFSDFVARTASWLSKLRLFVETEDEIPLGSTLIVEMRVPGRAVLIRALGEVGEVGVMAADGEATGVVVEVRYLDPASAKLIDSVLQHLPEKSEVRSRPRVAAAPDGAAPDEAVEDDADQEDRAEELLDTWEDEVGSMVEHALPAVEHAAAKWTADLDGTAVAPARMSVTHAKDRATVVGGKLVDAGDEHSARPGFRADDAIDVTMPGMETAADGEHFDDIEIADVDLEEAFAAVDRLDELEDTQPVVMLDAAALDEEPAAPQPAASQQEAATSWPVAAFDPVETDTAAFSPVPPPLEHEKLAWTGLETTKIAQIELDELAAAPPPSEVGSKPPGAKPAGAKLAGANLLLDAGAPQPPAEAALHRERLESLARKSQDGSPAGAPVQRRWPLPLLLTALLLVVAVATWWVMDRDGDGADGEAVAAQPSTTVAAADSASADTTSADTTPADTTSADTAGREPRSAAIDGAGEAAGGAETARNEPAPAAAQTTTVQLPPAEPPAAEPSAPRVAAAEASTAGLNAENRARAETAIRATVEQWRAAWSAQSPEAYLAAYARSFRPADGSSRAVWADQRRERLRAPSRIEVGVEQLRVEAVGDGTARVRFFQIYQTDALRRATWKRFDLVRDAGEWKISSEQVERGPAGGSR